MNNPEQEYNSLFALPHLANIMMMLLDRGEIQASELRLVSKNYAKIALLVKELETVGLVEKEVVSSPRVTYIYRLTEKGKLVAEKLKEIEEIIDG